MARLHVVSGKGGTGKTTVAAALALALTRGGRRVLLVEVEGRQGIAQLFDRAPLDYAERKLTVGPSGGDLFGLAVDPEEALLEYLELFYNLRRAGSALRRMGAIDFATTIAPGMRDVLLTGKVKEAVTRGRRGGPQYDAVVLDAPPTGRIVRFLNVNTEVAGLAKMGPVRTQADSVMALIRSPQTVVHLVTVLEEMPVQETIDGIADLRATDLPVGAVIVNMTRDPLLSRAALAQARRGRLGTEALIRGLAAAGLDAPDDLVHGLVQEATEHAARVAVEEDERRALSGLGRPTYELPLIADGVDVGALFTLADRLSRQGAA